MRKNSIWQNKKSHFPKFIFVFCLLFLMLLAFGVAREYLKRAELDREIIKLEQELAKLNFDKKDFLNSIESYKSGFFLEQEAREKMNYKKPGETVAVIPAAALSAEKTEKSEGGSFAGEPLNGAVANAAEWWNYFFGDKKL